MNAEDFQASTQVDGADCDVTGSLAGVGVISLTNLGSAKLNKITAKGPSPRPMVARDKPI